MSDEQGEPGTGDQPAGWYPDPGGQYESRYWDGSAWTHDVVYQGRQGTDASPIPAPGRGGIGVAGAVVTPGVGGYGPLGRGSGAGMLGMPLGVGTPRNTIVQENAPGLGAGVTLLGFAVFVAGLAMPWLGGDNAFTKPAGIAGAANQHWGTMAFFLAIAALWTLLAVPFATIRYQPGPLAGFLYGGIIGWLVCRPAIDRDAPSSRSNWLAVFVLLFYAGILWMHVLSLKGEIEDLDSSANVVIGNGPAVASTGFAIAVIGVIIGRRRKIITQPKG